MTDQLLLPPQSKRRTRLRDHSKQPLSSKQVPLTPIALFNTFKHPGLLDHIHDFRHSRVLPRNTNDNKTNGDSIPFLTLEKSTPQLATTDSNIASTSPSARASSGHTPSMFICLTCHTWICISASTYPNTCTNTDYATHHYHAKDSGTKSQKYECCGCGNHIEMSYHDAILPATLLSELPSTRALTRSPLDSIDTSANPTTPKPTISSTVTTCQTYIRDLLGNVRRQINSQKRHFVENVGLDDITFRLLGMLGFTFQKDGLFYPPNEVDNNRLCMIHEELGATLAKLASSATNQLSVVITEADYRPAAQTILDDLLGRWGMEDVTARPDTELDDLCANLGVNSSASDELLLWAYRKLTQELPECTHDLSETLETIATIKDSEFLRTELVMERNNQTTSNKRKVDKAYQYFGAQQDIDDDTIIAAYRYKKQDFPRGEATHDEKLRIIGESRKSDLILQYLESESINIGYQTARSRTTPVGLKNIGNTCYLNSLLQYYYTLLPFRNTIINMHDYVENEDNADWQGKKLGGIQIDQKEVKRAKKFMGLLQNNFIQLEHTSDYAIAPELELAKMALFNENEVKTLDNTGNTNVGDSSTDNSARTLDESNDSTTIDQQPSSESRQLNQTPETTITNHHNIDHDQVNGTNQHHSRLKSTSAKQTADMNTMMLGKQQDVTECMDNMMYLVEAALKSQHTDNAATQAKNVIRDLFYGKARQILSYKDNSTKKDIQKVMEEDFSHVIVDATKGKTLYDGLDEHYFAEKVENFQGGHEATREVTIQHLPPILQIQIQRAQFDRSTCQVYKSNAFIQFDKTIYLDRYIDSNFHKLASRREKVAMWRNQQSQCQQNIKDLSVKVDATTSTPVTIPVSWMLEKTASILRGSSDMNPTEVANAVGQLNHEALASRNTLEENIQQISEYETKIKDEYNDLKGCAYQLHAVFMHKGEANFGHYWLYIVDHKTGCWWKFNDSLVTKVKETEIFKDTSGTQSNPYFLVYIKKDLVDSLAAVSRSAD